MAKEYRINKLSDFLKIPEEKQAECIRDFACWINVCRQSYELQSELSEKFPDINAVLNLDSFIWIDDNKPGVSGVSFTVDGEVIATMKGQ